MHRNRRNGPMYSHPPVLRRDRVAGLLTSAIAEARLRASIGSSVELLVHRTVDEHVANVRRGPVAVSVVEICADTGPAHVSAVRMLRSQFPSVPVLAYCDSLPGLSRG